MAWCRLQHVDAQSNVTTLDIFGCVSEALNGTEGVSKLLPLNVQNCWRWAGMNEQRGEKHLCSCLTPGLWMNRLNFPQKCSFSLTLPTVQPYLAFFPLQSNCQRVNVQTKNFLSKLIKECTEFQPHVL